MPGYKCVIWDWNGTLLDDMDTCISVMNRILKCRRLSHLNAERYRGIFGFPVKGYYSELGFDFSKEPFEVISSEFVREYQKESLSSCIREESIAVLEYIRSLGLCQVILSASQIDNLMEQVIHFRIADYFDRLLGLDHIHATSKVEIGRIWLRESGIDAGDVLLVGDTLHDYETAAELGCDCILLSTGHQSRERLAAAGVPIINSLIEVKEYL